MFKRILCIIFCFLFIALNGCHSVYKKQDAVTSINPNNITPGATFIFGGNLYLSYKYNGAEYFLSAALPKEGKEQKKKYAVLEAHAVKEMPDLKSVRVQHIPIINDILERVAAEEIKLLAPKEKGTGVLLSTSVRDVVLFRDLDGAVKIMEPGSTPEYIKYKKLHSQKDVEHGTKERLISLMRAEHPGVKRFLIPIRNVQAVPFVYIDLDREFMGAVKLDDYYQVQKDISPVGFTTDMLYSFFIKSHVFAIIKAPFTSIHKLLAQATNFVYVLFSPSVKDLDIGPVPLDSSGGAMDLDSFNKYLDAHVRPARYKARLKLLVDGEEFFPHFINSVKNASESVDIRVYIYKTDPYALSISDQLKSRSNEGIKVRVIMDEINTVLNWTKTPELPYSPNFVMPNIKTYLTENSKVKVHTHPNTWATIDHSKVIVIDDKIAYTGGMNFGEEYRYYWHDMMIALEGPIVQKLQLNFNRLWAFTGAGGDFAQALVMASEDCYECYKKDYAPDMVDVRPLYTKPSRHDIFVAQLEAIKRAKQRIYIQNAYFSDNRIVKELVLARERGVDVRVILPSENDIGMMNANNRVKTNILITNGVRVYFYPGMSHVKAAIYDNWACVGSANFDRFSLFKNGEMSLGIDDPKFVQELNERLFQKDFAVSKEITEPLEVTNSDYVLALLSLQA